MILKKILLLALLSPFVLLTACNDEIEQIGSGEEAAVVYGLLDSNDSLHYIKITKAFVGSGNSLVTAQIEDSNYFKQVDVIVEELTNNAVTRTWVLKDTIIPNKESGVFYSPEQKVYFFKTSLDSPLIASENVVYRMKADIENGKFEVTGQTTIVSGMNITTPNGSSSFGFMNLNTQVGGYKSYNINFNKGTASSIEVNLDIIIDEYIGAVPTSKKFRWNVGQITNSEGGSPSSSLAISGEQFYNTIKNKVTVNSAITKRVLRSIETRVTGASSDFAKYIAINKPSTSLAQSKPTFTNLVSSNDRTVIGVFSSRNTVTNIIKDTDQINGNDRRIIDTKSMIELCQGPITGLLFFCTKNNTYIGESFYCQ